MSQVEECARMAEQKKWGSAIFRGRKRSRTKSVESLAYLSAPEVAVRVEPNQSKSKVTIVDRVLQGLAEKGFVFSHADSGRGLRRARKSTLRGEAEMF